MAPKNKSRVSGLYAIADSGFNPCASFVELVQRFVEGGCRLVQLRVKPRGGQDGMCGGKHALRDEVASIARRIAKLKVARDFTFIVNDDAEIAAEVGADGVHVGANDTPVAELRRRYGGKLLIGYSSHALEEAKRAAGDGADYVAFGAIFPTKTKGPGHPVQGVGRLREVVQSVGVPVVAIGGIGRGNVGQVLDAGASAVAMITALAEAPDIVAETQWFVKTIEAALPSRGVR